MKRLSALFIMGWLFLGGGSSIKERSIAKLSNLEYPQLEAPEDLEITAATPEDPGLGETTVSPLQLLKEQLHSSQPKSEAAALPQEPLPVDHPVYVDAGNLQHFLHRLFSVNNHAHFAFHVPAHQDNTRLRGTFRSFTRRDDPASSDRAADVDLMLLNEQEFSEFLHGQPQSVTYELDSAHNQVVDWRVPTTYGEPQTYHLVFSNPGSGTAIKFVEADFTVSFK
jgi:hypothetical protein